MCPEIISLSETVTPLLDIVKDIPPPQYREIQSLTEQLKYDNDFARERLILLHIRVALKIALSISKQYSYDIEENSYSFKMGEEAEKYFYFSIGMDKDNYVSLSAEILNKYIKN